MPDIAAAWWGAAPEAYWYGTTTVTLGHFNLPGNWLFVVATWRHTNDGLTPLAFVSDDAHNVYQQVSFSGAEPYIQVFACPNAQPTGTIYVSTNSYVRDLQVQVVEVEGLSSAYQLDTVQVKTGTGGTSFSVPFTATTNDYVLAFSATLSVAGAQCLPASAMGAPMSRVQPWFTWGSAVSCDGNVNGWTVGAGSSSASYTASRGTFLNWSGIVVAFKTAVGSPVYHSASNSAWPQIQVRAYFGYPIGNPTTPMTSYTDLSSRFLGLSGSRGRSFELDELNAADMTLTLDNADGWLSPSNTASPYYPNCTLITPVQVLATWQGRTYYLFYGYINAIPESYDFQRGQVKIGLSDDFTKLPQVLLQSAMVADCLYDNPTHLWPLNESQANFASNWSGRSTATLIVVNGAYGGGRTDGDPVTGFGANCGLQGTQDTCWGEWASIQPAGSVNMVGSCLVDRGDNGLPWVSGNSGCTYEVWAKILNNNNTVAGGATIFALMDDKGALAGGMYLKLTAVNVGTVDVPQTVLTGGHATTGNEGMHTWRVNNVFDGAWHHYAITVLGTKCTLYLDGFPVGTWVGSFPKGKPTRVMFGGDTTVPPKVYSKSLQQRRKLSGLGGIAGFFDGYLCNAACYDKVLDPERITSHYQSGYSGFDGDLTGIRIQRVLAWSRWAGPQAIDPGESEHQIFNYLGGTYGTGGLTGAIGQSYTAGGALLDSGSQADLTIDDIAASENGMLLIGCDGRLSFRERSSLFNVAASAQFGDLDYPLNRTTRFDGGLGEWTNATYCTVAVSQAWSYSTKSCAAITCTGGQSQAYVRGAPVSLADYPQVGASCWVMAPAGAAVTIAIDWLDSSQAYIGTTTPVAGAVTIPPMTPTQLTLPPSAAPTGAAYARFGPSVWNTPAAGTVVYFDRPRLSPGGFQVPYGDEAEITTDIQYLFNDVAITRNVDEATFRAKDSTSQGKYFKRTYTRVIYLSETDSQGIVDSAVWLLQDYSVPRQRVSNVKVDAAANPDVWPYVLGLDVGDVVSFVRNPVQGTPFAGNFLIIGIDTDFEADKAEFTYSLAPLPLGANQRTLMLDEGMTFDGVRVIGW